MTEEQIKHLVNRFLGWRLPEDFSPDDGISFKPTFNEHTDFPGKHQPVGTNLFDYRQAEAMVRHIIEGMPDGLEITGSSAVTITLQPETSEAAEEPAYDPLLDLSAEVLAEARKLDADGCMPPSARDIAYASPAREGLVFLLAQLMRGRIALDRADV